MARPTPAYAALESVGRYVTIRATKDLDHLTRAFSATLGTFLERAVMRLRAARS